MHWDGRHGIDGASASNEPPLNSTSLCQRCFQNGSKRHELYLNTKPHYLIIHYLMCKMPVWNILCLQMHLPWLQCRVEKHLICVAPNVFFLFFCFLVFCCCCFFFGIKQFHSISSQPGNFRFSNHIYLGQENLRCLCLTRWLANQGWLHWGLGHPKLATNIIEPRSNLVCRLPERRQLT